MEKKEDSLFRPTQLILHLYLTPKEMDYDPRSLLLQKCKKEWQDQCHVQKGYIKEVCSLQSILHEEIMEMIPNILFKASFNIISYFPTIGDQIPMTIDLIFNHGIFGHFYKLNVIVPVQYCQSHRWSIRRDFMNFVAVSEETPSRTLRTSEIWMVRLKHLRFAKETFSCIAEPVVSSPSSSS